MQGYLNEGKLAYDIKEQLNDGELAVLKPYNFLTFKPFIYAINVAEDDLKNGDTLIKEYAEKFGKPVAVISAKFEAELMELDEDEKEMFVEDLK